MVPGAKAVKTGRQVMLFKRRRAPKRIERIRDWLWPRRGWRRAGQYLWHRLARLPASPHAIAAGLASGAAISFTPFLGFHLLGAWLLSLPMRGNWIAAWLGTVIGNPWTFPFIWLAIYNTGIAVVGERGSGSVDDAVIASLSFQAIVAAPGRLVPDVIWPMAVGGLPYAVAVFALTYWSSRGLVRRYQDRRRARLDRAAKARGRRLRPAGH
ncbi:hypothetical protein EV659_106103 [Rhodothalassium salexigens DSM 2132]|uniref:DUF2062 domain-containing protein n=2 Tax=Rhodothalassium salexigens TaxID=1086 RepID=A0A4R2PJ26_RHOSA|nr:hypothetical protein EV659_106103 [Rhodothalassium salexigens DSM 2132]